VDDDWPEVAAFAGVDPLVAEESEELVDVDSLDSEDEVEEELDESAAGAPERLSVR
jgi:hypothetical protein